MIVLLLLGYNRLENEKLLLDSKHSTFLINQRNNIKSILPVKAINIKILEYIASKLVGPFFSNVSPSLSFAMLVTSALRLFL